MSIFELKFQSGEASLSVRRIAVAEAVSEPFAVSVWALSRRDDLDVESLVGQDASLRIESGIAHVRQDARLWQGVCSHVEQVQAESKGLSTYHLRIVPRLWLLTQRRGQRIYQHLSIPDIVDKLLAEWRIVPLWKVDRGRYPRLEFKVQHGESDYAFLARLLEEAGIAYILPDLGATKTTLVLSDQLQSGVPRTSALPFVDNPNEAAEREYVTHVRLAHEVRPGAATLRDHDFRMPARALDGEAPLVPVRGLEAKYEQYRYQPGAFLALSSGGGTPVADDKGAYRHDPARGTDLASRVLASMRADKRDVRFETNVVDLDPGLLFHIEHHPHPELGAGLLLVKEMALEAEVGREWSVRGRAVFADPKVPYRPAHKTPRPLAHGLQSATVVGPPGAEIHTDEFGRVRVRFHWDRHGLEAGSTRVAADDRHSAWLRVDEGWAGAGFGLFTLPRVGQEVLVAFLDGDPDQPIIAGRAFNGRELVPYKLPENKTVSTWKSCSSPGGAGYNEIKYDDQAGQELVYLQAQRDKHQLVKRDQIERTGRHRRATVAGDEDLVVKGTRKKRVLGGEHVHVKLNRNEQVDGGASVSVLLDRDERVGGSHALAAGQTVHITAGATMVLEAGLRLTLKGPGGFIDIHPGGIDIVGNIVNLNSGGAPGSALGAHPTAPLLL